MVHYFLHNYPFCAYVAPKYTILYIYQKSSFYAYVCVQIGLQGLGYVPAFLYVLWIYEYIHSEIKIGFSFFLFFLFQHSVVCTFFFFSLYFLYHSSFILIFFYPLKNLSKLYWKLSSYSNTFFSTYLFLKSKFWYYIVYNFFDFQLKVESIHVNKTKTTVLSVFVFFSGNFQYCETFEQYFYLWRRYPLTSKYNFSNFRNHR